MKKKLTFISSILILCSIHCFAQAPNVTYLTSDTLTAGVEMTALKPTSPTDKAVTYAINPQPADGLKFDTGTGIITGKPGAVSTTDYQITATKDKAAGFPFTIKIVVRQAPCDQCGCSAKAGTNTNCSKTSITHCLCPGEWWLVFTPLILFVIFLTVFLIYINSKAGQVFSLKQALSESTYPQIIVDNPNYTDTNIQQLINLEKVNTAITALPIITLFSPTITKTDNKYRPSMSRLIAFLTSATSMIIGVGLSCFFIYWYLKTGCVADIGKLAEVLLAMGIGVVPYAANKLSNIGGGNK